MAMVGALVALNKGDQTKFVQCRAEEAAWRSKLLELDAQAASEARKMVRKFAAGGTVELRASQTDGIVSGWASTPHRDSYGHEIVNGAFEQSIRERGLTGPRAIKLLLDHDWTKPAGLITKLEYRSGGLWMEAELDLSIEYVRDRYSIMKKLDGFNFSVGFLLEDYKTKQDRDKVDFLEITRGDLFEVSLVAFPGNEHATASVKGKASLQTLLTQLQNLNRSIK